MDRHLQRAFTAMGRQLAGWATNVRQSARSLRRRPWFLAVSALSLGLGIGLNSLLYMGISRIYGGQATMHEPKRVVGVELGTGSQLSYRDYKDLLESDIFSGALGFRSTTLSFGQKDNLTRVNATIVTGNY